MKVFKDDSVYVQLNNIIFLTQTGIDIPERLFKTLFLNGINRIDETNKYDFIRFTQPEVISFFKSISFIPDYAELNELSREVITELINQIADVRNNLASQTNENNQKGNHYYTKLFIECEKLDCKLATLNYVLYLRENNITFELPENSDVIPSKPTDNPIKRILDKFKKRNGKI